MLNLLFNPPRDEFFIIACSGGVDSMAAADFFLRGNKKFSLAYFNHGTPQANDMQDFVSNYADKNNLCLVLGSVFGERNPKQSQEEFWRNQRYEFLLSWKTTVVTCHHLNDVAETWLFSSMHGNPKIIPVRNGMVVRPFLSNTKQQLIDWCVRHDVKWLEDQSNKDVKYPRNRIRHNILPQCLEINPGLLTVMRKKVLASISNGS